MKLFKGKRIAALVLALLLAFTSMSSDLTTISSYASTGSGRNVTLTLRADGKSVSQDISAWVNRAEADGEDWTWTSSDTSIATVAAKTGKGSGRGNENAVVTAVSAGTVTITATRTKTIKDYRTLTCDLEEHEHGDWKSDCYSLTCGKTEHSHGDYWKSSCYTLDCDNWWHKHVYGHDKNCYKLTCTQEEHRHDPSSCYSLTCTTPEHQHTADCYADITYTDTYTVTVTVNPVVTEHVSLGSKVTGEYFTVRDISTNDTISYDTTKLRTKVVNNKLTFIPSRASTDTVSITKVEGSVLKSYDITNISAYPETTVSGEGTLKLNWTRSADKNLNVSYASIDDKTWSVETWKWSDVSDLATTITDYKQVWDGKYAANYDYSDSTINHNFASWEHTAGLYKASVRRFTTSFTYPAGYNIADNVKISSTNALTDGNGNSILPVNDDVYIFAYPQGTVLTDDNYMDYLVFWTGTSNQGGKVSYNGVEGTQASKNGSASLRHTDGWYCVASVDNLGEKLYELAPLADQDQVFVIDMFCIDYAEAGAIDELYLTFTDNPAASVVVNYYKDDTLLKSETNKKESVGVVKSYSGSFVAGFESELAGYNEGEISITKDGTPIDGTSFTTEDNSSYVVNIVYKNKNGLTAASESAFKTYDGSALTASATASYSGNVSDYSKEDATIQYAIKNEDGSYGEWTETAPSRTAAGTTTYKVRAISNSAKVNNSTESGDYTLTVSPKTITYTIDNKTKKTNEADPTFTGHFAEGDIVDGANIVATIERANKSNDVAKYELTATFTGNEAGNYDIRVNNGTLTVNPGNMTVSMGDDIVTDYSGSAVGHAAIKSEADATVSYTVNGVAYTGTGYPTFTEVGDYTVVATVTKNNYTTATDSYVVKINKLKFEVTVNNYSKTYGTSNADIMDKMGYTTSSSNPDGFVPVLTYSIENASENANTYVGAIKATLTNSDANYEVTVNPGTLTINPLEVATSVTNKTYTYNGMAQGAAPYENEFVDVTYTPYKADGTLDTANATSTVPSKTAAGTYKYQVTFAPKDSNHTVSNATKDYTLTINPKAVTVKINGNIEEKEFNNSLQAATGYTKVQPTGLEDALWTELSTSIKTKSGVSASATGTAVGTYYMGLTNASFEADTDNYTVTFDVTDGYLKIKPNTSGLTLTGSDKTKNYDGNALFAVATASNPEGASVIVKWYSDAAGTQELTSVPTVTNVSEGQKTVYARAIDTTGSYAATGLVTCTIQVNPAAVMVGVTGETKSHAYDGNEYSVSNITFTLPEGSDLALADVNNVKSGAFSFSAAQTVPGTAYMGMTNDNVNTVFENTNTNYNVTYYVVSDGYVTITQNENAINITSKDGSKTYDGTALTKEEADVTGSLVAGHSFEYNFTGTITEVGSEANTFTYKVVDALGNDVTSYYKNITTANGTLSVSKRNVTVKVTGNVDDTAIYNGSAQSVSGYTATTTDTVYDLSRLTKPAQSDVVAEGTSAGTYTTDIKEADFANYDTKNFNVNYAITQGAITIAPKTVNFTINNNQSKTYGAADPELTGTFEEGGIIGDDVVTYVITRDAGENANTYHYSNVTFGGKDAGNYDVKVTNRITLDGLNDAKFIINPAQATVTAKNATITYGDMSFALDGTGYTVTGLVSGDEASVISATVTTDLSERYEVGSYEKEIEVSGNEAQGNYDVNFVNGDLTVVAKELKVTLPTEVEKTYGDEDPELIPTVVGAEDGDDVTVTLARKTGETVGEYAITATISGNDADNYDLVVENEASLTIVPKTVNVTVNDASKTFGDADPEFSVTFEEDGLLENDTVGYSFEREEGENAGTYAITADFENVGTPADGEELDNKNYTFKVTKGSLTINKRNIVIKANDASKNYGDADPNFTTTTTNAVASDPVEAYAWRYAGEAVGTYGIAVTVKKVSSNYNVQVLGGTFTIYGEDVVIVPEETPNTPATPATPQVTPIAPTQVVEIEEEAVPEAEAVEEAEEVEETEVNDEPEIIEIPDEAVPETVPGNCWIHWVILAITIIYALYAILRGIANARELNEEEKEQEMEN